MKYFEPSDKAKDFQLLIDFVRSCHSIEVGYSVSAPDYNNWGDVRLAIELTNTPNCKLHAINHDGSIEIYRLRLKAKSILPFANDNSTSHIEEVVKKCEDYLKSDDEVANRYMQQDISILKHNRIINYSYLSRRCTQMAVFRNAVDGATKALQRTIAQMIENNQLTGVDKADSVGGVCYKINW